MNYMVLFENEADANAYDNSIKSASIAGIDGVIDPVEHTITFDVPLYAVDTVKAAS